MLHVFIGNNGCNLHGFMGNNGCNLHGFVVEECFFLTFLDLLSSVFQLSGLHSPSTTRDLDKLGCGLFQW